MGTPMRYQPQGRLQLASSRLASMLAASVVPSQSQSAVLNRPIKTASGVARVATPQGIAFQHSAANGTVDFGATGGLDTVIPPGTSFTLFFRLFVSVLGVRQGILTDHNASGGGESYTVEITAANEWKVSTTGGSNAAVIPGVTAGWHDVCVVYRAGIGHQMWVDGGPPYGTAFGPNLNAGSALRLGGFGAYPSLGFQGRIAVCHIFKGDASTYLSALTQNPWQLFDAGSGSSAYQSAIATPGATTGNATATITGAKASPAAGTITASGGAAATLPGAASTAQAGTISASGGAGASLIGAPMSAAAGAIVASGGAGAALPGAASTAQAGTITASGGAGATVPGAQGGIAAGSIAASGAANASVSSAGATFQAGTISATAGGSANVALVGVAMSSAAGTVTASGGASATIPGATSSAQAGQVTGSGGAQIGIVGAAVMLQAGLMSAAAVSGDVVARLPGAGMVASAGVIVAVGTRSGIDVNVTEDMICAVVRGYIKSIAPALRVIRTPVNKASMPTGAYVSFTPGVRRPLSTNVTDTASNERIIGRSEQMGFQIDCYGDGSADLAETLNTLFRDGYAVESFARAEFEIVPLFANDIMQAPFVNDSEQYEERYTFQIELQVKSSITVPQDSCNILSVDLISVDATYPH